MQEVSTASYWIASNALYITLNANGAPNYILGNTASGAHILCYVKGVDGLEYDAAHNYRRWPLSLTPTKFNTNTEKYVYVAIPRPTNPETTAVVVFPSEKLDLYGKNEAGRQIGSELYYYVWLRGIITATNAGETLDRDWQQHFETGTLSSDEAIDAGGDQTWWRYSSVDDTVTFLKEILMDSKSFFHNLKTRLLVLAGHELTGVATAETSEEFVDSETLVVTPNYLRKMTEDKFLRKDQDDATPYSLSVGGDLNVGGTLRGIVGYFTSLFSNLLQSSNYTGDGAADTGFRLTADDGSGSSSMIVDVLHVRKKAIFEELEVKKEMSVAGNEVRSAAANIINRTDYINGQGEVIGYSYTRVPWMLRKMPFLLRGTFFGRLRKTRIVIDPQDVQNIQKIRCYFLAKDGDRDVQNLWQVGDLVRCQTFNLSQSKRYTYIDSDTQNKPGNVFWWRKSVGVSTQTENIDGKDYHYVDVSMSDRWHTNTVDSDIPCAGDHMVQFGHDSNPDRMNLIVQEVNSSDAPAVKAYMGIYTYDESECWWGGTPRKMMLSPKSGYEFYGPSFKFIQEYGQAPASIDRGVYTEIATERDDFNTHGQVRKLYYYDKVSHNGCYWLCVMTGVGAHWVAKVAFTETVGGTTYTFSAGDYIPDNVYSGLVTNKTNCTRKENYTTEAPSETSTSWKKLVNSGDNMVRLDIDNELDAVQTDSTCKVTAQRTITTNVRLYDGATEVAINNPTVTSISYTDANGQQQTLNPVITASGNGKQLSWTFLAGWTLQARYQVNISYTYLDVPYTAVFTLTASQGFEVLQLKPSLSSISFQRDASNQLTPASRTLGLSIVKIDGASTADITPATYGVSKIRYSLTEMPALISSGSAWPAAGTITVPNTAENVYIALFNIFDVLIDRETVPVIKDGAKGASGTSPYFADIDNEMDSVALDTAGKTTAAYDKTINLALWHGSDAIDISTLSYKVNGGTSYTDERTVDSIKVTPNATAKTLRVRVADATALAITNEIEITIAGTGSGNHSLHFVLNGVKPGANGNPATIYSLVPSVSSVVRKKDGTYSVDNVSCTRQKNVGGTITDNTTDGTIECYLDGVKKNSYSNNEDIAVTGFTKSVKFVFKIDSTVVDSETILMVDDGSNGSNGLYYVDDYGRASSRNLNNGFPEGFDSTTGWQSTAPATDNTYKYIWKRSRQYNPNTSQYGTASYTCLTGEGGNNGADAWAVTASPSPLIINQNINNASDFGLPIEINFTGKCGDNTATVGTVTAQNGMGLTITNGSGKITITQYSKVNDAYVTSGVIVCTVPLSYGSRSTNVTFRISVGVNLIGDYSDEIKGDMRRELAHSSLYEIDNDPTSPTYGEIIETENWGEFYRSSTENISKLTKQVNNGKNMLSLTKGWEGYEGAAVQYDGKNFGVRNADGNLYSPVFVGVEGETYCFSVYLAAGYYQGGNPGFCYDSVPPTHISDLDVDGTYQSASFIEVTGDTITIGNTTYQRYYFLIPGSVVKERYFTIYNDGNYWFYCPQLEVGNYPTEFSAGSIETSSQIKQTADKIEAAVNDTGVNIQDKTISLFADKVRFYKNKASATSGDTAKIWIDGSDGSLHAVDGHFEGNVKSGAYTENQQPKYANEINADGSGHLAKGNVSWDVNGNLSISGKIVAKAYFSTPKNLPSGETYTIDLVNDPYIFYLSNQAYAHVILPDPSDWFGVELDFYFIPGTRMNPGQLQLSTFDGSNEILCISGSGTDMTYGFRSSVKVEQFNLVTLKSMNGFWYTLNGTVLEV